MSPLTLHSPYLEFTRLQQSSGCHISLRNPVVLVFSIGHLWAGQTLPALLTFSIVRPLCPHIRKILFPLDNDECRMSRDL